MSNNPGFSLPLKYWAVIFAFFILVPIIGAQYILNYKFLRTINENYIESSVSNLSQYIEKSLLYPMATADTTETKRIADEIASRPEVFAIDVFDASGTPLYRAENPSFSLEQGFPIKKKHIPIIDSREAVITDSLEDRDNSSQFVYGQATLYITPEAMNRTFEQQLYLRSMLFLVVLLLIVAFIYLMSDYNRRQVNNILGIMKDLDGRGAASARKESVISEFSDIATGLVGLLGKIRSNIDELRESKETAEQARLVAEQASQLKAEFIHNMSHEIRTPTNSITNLIEVLELQARASKVDPLFLQHLTICKQASVELKNAVDELVDFEKMEAGEIPVTTSQVDVTDFFSFYPLTYASKFDSTNITFRVVRDKHSASLRDDLLVMDDKKVHRILVNILENALKYTQQGAVTLTWKIANDNDQLRLAIAVADSGIGIREEDLQQIFLPFFRAESAIKKRRSGSGIGLSVVKKMLDTLGGDISVTSKVGIGTTFNISIPVEAMSTDAGNEPPDVAVPHPLQLSSVIIDDNENNCYTMTQMLKEMGIDTLSFTNPHEALEHLGNNWTDVIFVDYHMPLIDGIELVSLIRKLPASSNSTIICVTADTHPNIKELIATNPVDGLLIKPINRKELHSTLKNVLTARDYTKKIISKVDTPS